MRTLHWLSAVLIIALVPLGIVMTRLGDGENNTLYRAHVGIGMLVSLLTIARVVWHLPTFNSDLPEGASRKATPSEAIVGRLHDDTTVSAFSSALADAGIEDSRIHVLSGPDGIEVLDNLGTPLGRLFGPDRQEAVELLKAGATLVGVFGVPDHDQDQIATAVANAGVQVIHRFGTWTYS